PDAVGRYQAERDELSLRLFRVTGRIAAFDWTPDDIGGHLLELKDAMAEEIAAMTDRGDDPGQRLDPARRPPPASAQTGTTRPWPRPGAAGLGHTAGVMRTAVPHRQDVP